MNLQLIQEAGLYKLLDCAGAASYRHIFVVGGGFGLREGVLYAVSNKRKTSSSLFLYRFPGMMGQDEYRYMKRRIIAPPAVGIRVIFPWAFAAAEHFSA